MALIQCEFKSDVLGKTCAMNVVIPQLAPAELARRVPVVYLLHGLSDDHSMWERRTCVELYAEQRGLAVVMPDGGRSFYTDMKCGGRFFSFISEELPQIAESLFPVAAERGRRFAAGLSMGGYGAMKLALRCPEKFAAAGALSAVTDIPAHMAESDVWYSEFQQIFGTKEQAVADGNDLFTLAVQQQGRAEQTDILEICGVGDPFCGENHKLRDHFAALQRPGYAYREYPGAHTWEFWNTHVQELFDFFVSHLA